MAANAPFPIRTTLRQRSVDRARACVLAATVLLAMLGGIPAAAGCEPGQEGCLPTPERCASGDVNGWWDGGAPGRFAVCAGAAGQTVAYAGGTVLPSPCGHVVVAGATVPGTGGDPNDCFPPGGGPDGGIAVAAAGVGLRACSGGATDPATPPTVAFTTCVGEVRSFDGLELDARLTFPSDASGPVPLVVLLHGWTGSRVAWQPPTTPDRTDVLGRGAFLAEGYAVLATTARGWYASCSTLDPVADLDASGSTGPAEEDPAGCARGWTHLAERDVEGRDTQHLVGLLVDAGVADADRVAVLGESYGGGQAWLLATALPWRSPLGRRVQLAAAVSLQGWTDLLDALAPTGRADDRAGLPAAPGPRVGPLKASFVGALWGSGRVQPVLPTADPVRPLRTMARYNTLDPTEHHSFFDGWLAAFEASDPHDAVAAAYLDGALAGKSAWRAQEWFDAVAARDVQPTPVLALQGWTDALFTPVQTLQMYARLKALRADYPVSIAFADGGHGAPPRPEQWSLLQRRAVRFVVAHLSGGSPGPKVESYRVACDGDPDVSPVAAGSWRALAPRTTTMVGEGTGTTTSVSPDPATELALDPVAGFRGCASVERAPTSAARWSWDVPSGGLETLGLQRLAVGYELTGVDATLVARVWQARPDGTRILVTSGVYVISALAGDPLTGTVDFALAGTHWRFAAGSTIELELSQTDAPYLRPRTTPSSLSLSTPRLTLPTRPAG